MAKTEDGVDRGGGDDQICRDSPCVRDDVRPFALHLDVMNQHTVSDVEPIQHLVEEGVKSAGRIEVRGFAWKAERSDLGNALEPAELAPNSGHLLKPESPELLVETIERKRGQRGPDRQFEVVAEIPLCRRRLCPFDLGQLAFDLLATGKLTEALVINGKRDDRIFRSEARSLVDQSLLEIDEASQERKDLLRAPENADYPRAVFVGKTLFRVQCSKHPARNLVPLEQRNAGIELLAQQRGSAGAGKSGADDDDVHPVSDPPIR